MDYTNWTIDDASRRKQDELQEKVVGKYLDKYFYSTWTTDITRNLDVDTQIKGLDLTITSTNNNVYTIDEKAAVKWTNKQLNTFAFEVDSLDKNGKLYNGWLLKKDAVNDYWLCIWIDKADNSNFSKVEDIEQVTVSLIKKEDMYNWLHSKHITGKELKQKATDLRDNFNLNNNYTYTHINGNKLTIQPTYNEHAINILLPRNVLVSQISTYSAIVRKNNVEVITRKVGI